MMKGVRRGCVRLKGAVIGIDDQDVNTFTITVDHKTFHFQVSSNFIHSWIIFHEINYCDRHAMVKSVKSGCDILRTQLLVLRNDVEYIMTLRRPFRVWVDRQQVENTATWRCLIEKWAKPTHIYRWWLIRQRKLSSESMRLKMLKSVRLTMHLENKQMWV